MEMKESWRVCAAEIRERSGLGTGLLERALRVGDGTGRGWRRWMAPAPPMPRQWPELIEEAQRRGWLTNHSAQGLVDAAVAAGERLERARERASGWPHIQPPVLPFQLPPKVPDDVFFLGDFVAWKLGRPCDARVAARLLGEDSQKATQRIGAGSGSGGASYTRYRNFLQSTPEGKEWLAAVKALRPTVEKLGLGVADPREPGRPVGNPHHNRQAARDALLDALQAAYERLGYPPPP